MAVSSPGLTTPTLPKAVGPDPSLGRQRSAAGPILAHSQRVLQCSDMTQRNVVLLQVRNTKCVLFKVFRVLCYVTNISVV
jgi:hypothetical protein